MSQSSSQPASAKVDTLPDDLKKIATKLINKKFGRAEEPDEAVAAPEPKKKTGQQSAYLMQHVTYTFQMVTAYRVGYDYGQMASSSRMDERHSFIVPVDTPREYVMQRIEDHRRALEMSRHASVYLLNVSQRVIV